MIPVNEPFVGENDIRYVMDALKTGWISSEGKYITEFEKKWAQYCGMKHGIAVSNGTTALEVAVRCLGLKPGDEIIMPTFTIISCALAAVYNGCKPVLVDSDPVTWTMDVRQIERAVTKKTRAIMPVHIYGHPCDMGPIRDIAKKHGLFVIEDAAEAHGAEYKGGKCGSFGDISCFSFYANKIITTGEGGMLLTNNDEFAEKARSHRNLCFRKERRFYHTELGNNFRLTNLQAAIGLAQVERIEDSVAKKRRMGKFYTEELKGIDSIELPVEMPWAKNVYWMYGLVLKEKSGLDAMAFAKLLKDQGVDTRPFFLGMHEQPVFHEMGYYNGEKHPVAERIARQGLYLPSGMTITDEQMEEAAATVRKILNGAR